MTNQTRPTLNPLKRTRMGINAETDWETQHRHITNMAVPDAKQMSNNNDTKRSEIRWADDDDRRA